MRVRLWIAGIAGAMAVGLGLVWWCWGESGDLPTPMLTADARELKESEVCAWLDRPIVAGKSIVWCGTLQLAWNVMSDEMAKEPLHLQGTPEMETQLNKQLFTAGDLDPASYLAMAGFINDGISRARSIPVYRLNSGRMCRMLKRPPWPAQGVCWPMHIYRQIWNSPANSSGRKEPLTWAGSSANGTQLLCFGTEVLEGRAAHAAREQVIVHDYASDDDFVVELQTKATDERLILALVPPEGTLRMRRSNASRNEIDAWNLLPENKVDSVLAAMTLKVPLMDFNITRQYNEIIGRKILNAALRDDPIVEASQRIRWRFTEKGAVLKSESMVAAKSAMVPIPMRSEFPQLIFNRPFLLYLQRNNAKLPYFVMWVANPELYW